MSLPVGQHIHTVSWMLKNPCSESNHRNRMCNISQFVVLSCRYPVPIMRRLSVNGGYKGREHDTIWTHRNPRRVFGTVYDYDGADRLMQRLCHNQNTENITHFGATSWAVLLPVTLYMTVATLTLCQCDGEWSFSSHSHYPTPVHQYNDTCT